MEDDTMSAIDRLRDLAFRMLDPAFSSRTPAQEPRLFEGRLPPDLPVPIPIPENSHLIGSYVDGRKKFTVILDVPTSREAVFAYYDEQLTHMGWTRIHAHPNIGGIMHDTSPPSPVQGGTYCRSAHGPAIILQGIATSDEQTDLRLHLHTDPIHTPCARPGHPAGSDATMPVLSAPPESEWVPTSAGGGQEVASFWGRLVTELDMRDVLSHYTEQLELAGWTRRIEEEHGHYLWSTWICRAHDMSDRYGTLFISLLRYEAPHPRIGASQLTERPNMVQQYAVEVHSRWRADVVREKNPGGA